MTKYYELTLLLTPDASEPDLERAERLVIRSGFEIVKRDDEGIKKLAYQIRGQERAQVYYYSLKKLDEKAPCKLADQLNGEDAMVRYLIVRMLKENAKKLERELMKSGNGGNARD